MSEMTEFTKIVLNADFCVVGGGMAGVCAAVAAARRGARTVLIQDRPVLGGNASGEIRMQIGGAGGKNVKEGGILEEIELENIRWNPSRKYQFWDHVLINFVQRQPNMTLLLNCTCTGVNMLSEHRIRSVNAWQMTTQKQFEVCAKTFADCSGDSVLRVCGAKFRRGREAKNEYDESHAPDFADEKSMGNSILFQTREVAYETPYERPPWAHAFEEKGFHRGLNCRDNFWWMETGGEGDTIADAEEIRDDLLKIAHGVWDLMKNGKKAVAEHCDIEWIGVLPGKRENVRYIGDHVMTQNDIEKQGRFDDIVAYGGWCMDDHNPAAFYHKGAPSLYYPAPSPYGIPFRALYSVNIDNLYFAGRNISCSHAAMSSTRVMATCSIEGQAVGTAAAIGNKYGLDPRGVYEQKITELQNTLMDDDCWLPWHTRPIPEVSAKAELMAESDDDAELLRNGQERNNDAGDQFFAADFGSYIEYHFAEPVFITEARLVFDSNLLPPHSKTMPSWYPLKGWQIDMPEELVKEFSLKVKTEVSGDNWKEIAYVEDNCRRLVRIPVGEKITAIRLIPEASWGAEKAHIFAFDVR